MIYTIMGRLFALLLANFAIALVIGRHIDEKVKLNKENSIPVYVSSIQSRNRGHNYDVRIDLLGKSSVLKLHPVPNRNLSPSLKVLSADFKNGKLHFENEEENHELHPIPKLYTDKGKKASLTMKQIGRYIEIDGVLNSKYSIHPVPLEGRHAHEKTNHVILKRTHKKFNPDKHCALKHQHEDKKVDLKRGKRMVIKQKINLVREDDELQEEDYYEEGDPGEDDDYYYYYYDESEEGQDYEDEKIDESVMKNLNLFLRQRERDYKKLKNILRDDIEEEDNDNGDEEDGDDGDLEEDEDYEDYDDEYDDEDNEINEDAGKNIAKIEPEILLILDYEQSKHFDFDVAKVKEYLSVLFYQVNRLYKSVEDFQVNVIISGILLTKSPDAQPYLQEIYQPKHGVNAEKTVDTLEEWAIDNKLKDKFHYDIISLSFSGDLGEYEKEASGGQEIVQWSESPMGICSQVGGACIFNRDAGNVALSEDTAGFYNGIDTHAHEIAHLLGSTHSGESPGIRGEPSAQDCPSSLHYIMRENSDNRFLFGPCASKQIRWLSNRKRGQCLWNHPASPEVNNKEGFPGKWISLQKQCETAYMDTNIKYIPNTNPADVCRKMLCKLPGYMAQTWVPAMEGTPCGNDKHCIRGTCIANAEIEVK